MGIENTAKRPGELHVLGALSDGPDGYITGMEADGQRQIVNSDRLPTRVQDRDGDQAYLAVGFTFGEPDPEDRMFRPATLPAGWAREGSSHSMWSYIVDQHGRRRVSIFYKAAFYDRDAFMGLQTPYAYFNSLLYEDGSPILDDEWITPQVADEALAAIRDRQHADAAQAREFASRPGERNEYWPGRAAECDAEADKAEALRLRIAETASRE